MPRHEQLIELVVLHDAETRRRTGLTDDTNIRERGTKPFSKIRQRANAREWRRNQMGMCFMPAVEPELCEWIDLGGFRSSDVHF